MSMTAEIAVEACSVEERLAIAADRLAEQSTVASMIGGADADGTVYYGIDFRRIARGNETSQSVGAMYFSEGGVLLDTRVARGIGKLETARFLKRVCQPVRRLVRDVYCEGSDFFDSRLDGLLGSDLRPDR